MTLMCLLPACRTVHKVYEPDTPPSRVAHSAALKSSLRNITSLVLTRLPSIHC
ncbi:uncharacterized protein PHACADRAFT_253127 [Phanerochaete carnosa HHB-10118-sp]|uniref:Uncharacterized protein n=1 Tax=Phanerochaete carnosa (strain HHB-10118-sp) TaxID=650164 RepID=K5WHP9_PHACS|nr:uncharacterized protein PHACADRAFT_253127 [Phanerochaete carnosa HHB-10118-sp]EKM58649.1 hypothetical protein PHACADRAFT_253127 [Phanerochaete carnosa HHB-10118-sp]